MKLGVSIGLSRGNIVLDGDPALPLPQGAQPRPNFRPMSVVAKRLYGSRCYLVWRYTSAQAILCYMGTQTSPLKGAQQPPFSADVYCGQMVANLSYC